MKDPEVSAGGGAAAQPLAQALLLFAVVQPRRPSMVHIQGPSRSPFHPLLTPWCCTGSRRSSSTLGCRHPWDWPPFPAPTATLTSASLGLDSARSQCASNSASLGSSRTRTSPQREARAQLQPTPVLPGALRSHVVVQVERGEGDHGMHVRGLQQLEGHGSH